MPDNRKAILKRKAKQEKLMKTDYGVILHSSRGERKNEQRLLGLLKSSPIPDDELLANLGLYLTSKNFSRLLFFYEIYKKVSKTHGVMMEFGTRWGQITSLLSVLRGIFEPFNRTRKVIGFDTFSGHRDMSEKDGNISEDGAYSLPADYAKYVANVLQVHEDLNPLSHIRKFELVKGDVVVTLPRYLEKHPETIVSLAVFDIDLYKPTKEALAIIQPYLCKGSILVFDELCDEVFPGATQAVREVMPQLRLQRMPMTSRLSYCEVEK